MLRGGSWINNARNCRSANRNRNEPANRKNNVGFRFAQPGNGMQKIDVDASVAKVEGVDSPGVDSPTITEL